MDILVCTRPVLLPLLASVSILGAGCSKHETIRIDGSSTVFPVSMAVAEEFSEIVGGVQVTVSYSGTGGGMKQFTAGEIDICDASRGIKESEKKACAKAGIDFLELTVAFDGLAVVVNPRNDWCSCLTVDQLKTIWRPESDGTVTKWSDINPDWPEQPLKLYGPGTDSGTFDYFTKVICGEEKASRPDYTASENDNALVRGVEADKGALGYFGYAYYAENKDKLKLLAVESGAGCIAPSDATVMDGTYAPLSRPLYIYVSKSALARPELAQFVEFYLANGNRLVSVVGYVPISDEVAEKNGQLLKNYLAR